MTTRWTFRKRGYGLYQTDIWGEQLRQVRLHRLRFRRLGFFLSGISRRLAKAAGHFKRPRRYLDSRAFTGQQLMLRRVHMRRYLPFKVRSFNRFLRKYAKVRRFGTRSNYATNDLFSNSVLANALEMRVGSLLTASGAYKSAAHMRQCFSYKSGEARFIGHLNKRVNQKGFIKLAPSMLEGVAYKTFRVKKLANLLLHPTKKSKVMLSPTNKRASCFSREALRTKFPKSEVALDTWMRSGLAMYSTNYGFLRFPDASLFRISERKSLAEMTTGLPPLVRLKHK